MSDNYHPSQEERNLAMFCHLGAFAGFIFPFGSIIVPLVIWLTKKDESPYIDYHGKESLNFQISVMIAMVIAAILIFVIIGIPLLIALVLFEVVMLIIASIKTSEGAYYRYPISLRLIN